MEKAAHEQVEIINQVKKEAPAIITALVAGFVGAILGYFYTHKPTLNVHEQDWATLVWAAVMGTLLAPLTLAFFRELKQNLENVNLSSFHTIFLISVVAGCVPLQIMSMIVNENPTLPDAKLPRVEFPSNENKQPTFVLTYKAMKSNWETRAN